MTGHADRAGEHDRLACEQAGASRRLCLDGLRRVVVRLHGARDEGQNTPAFDAVDEVHQCHQRDRAQVVTDPVLLLDDVELLRGADGWVAHHPTEEADGRGALLDEVQNVSTHPADLLRRVLAYSVDAQSDNPVPQGQFAQRRLHGFVQRVCPRHTERHGAAGLRLPRQIGEPRYGNFEQVERVLEVIEFQRGPERNLRAQLSAHLGQVQAVAAGHVLDAARHLGLAAGGVGAYPDRGCLIFVLSLPLLEARAAAARAFPADVIHQAERRPGGTLVDLHMVERDGADHFGDDRPSLADDDPVAHGQPQAVDLVLVVQRGARDDASVHLDRFQLCHGRQDAAAAHLDGDGLQRGLDLLLLELEGDGPPRRPGCAAEVLAQVVVVHLDDDAVGRVGLLGDLLQPFRRDRRARSPVAAVSEEVGLRRELEPQRSQPLRVVAVTVGRHTRGDAVRDERQPLVEHLPGILPAQDAGRSVARVGVELLPRCLLPLVERPETVKGHEDLAVDLDRPAIQFQRHHLGFIHIRRDVVPGLAVAAGDRFEQRYVPRQLAASVGQTQTQPVDLRLGDQRAEFAGLFAVQLRQPLGQLSDVAVIPGEHVVQ